MKKLSERAKANMALYAAAILIAVVFLGVFFWINSFAKIPKIVFYLLAPVVVVAGMILVDKVLKKTRLKAELEKMDEEALKELEDESGRSAKPRTWSIALASLICLIGAGVEGFETVRDMIEAQSFKDYLPDFIFFLTILIIGLILAKITYNVWKGRIFSQGNYTLIYFLSATIFVSNVIQGHYWESTEMVPNDTVSIFYYLLSIIILFLGNLFEIAIKVKADQDLTI